MRILLAADGRSPITLRWIEGLLAMAHRVTLVSTYPCKDIKGIDGLHILPVAFGNLGGSQSGTAKKSSPKPGLRNSVSAFRPIFLASRYIIGPMTLPYYGQSFRRLVEAIKPDLVHALRIPFEGMLASYTPNEIPLAVSIWGNDLTFHAQGSKQMGAFSRRTLERADGLAADTFRDIILGDSWGFRPDHPKLVVPGNGGIDKEWMEKSLLGPIDWPPGAIPEGVELVVNPRGLRPGSIRSDVFFNAIPMILQRNPKVGFLCAGMAGQPEAASWVRRLNISRNVRLLPFLTQARLWHLFKLSRVSLSISIHDGTPNSLLEAMALGCFPIAGDIQSIREWIVPGVNGLLVEPTKPQSVAEAVVTALDNPELCRGAALYNQKLIQERASVAVARAQIEQFYQTLVSKKAG